MWSCVQDLCFAFEACVKWTPHPVVVTVRDNGDYIRALVHSDYTTITGWGVHLRPIQSSIYSELKGLQFRLEIGGDSSRTENGI